MTAVERLLCAGTGGEGQASKHAVTGVSEKCSDRMLTGHLTWTWEVRSGSQERHCLSGVTQARRVGGRFWNTQEHFWPLPYITCWFPSPSPCAGKYAYPHFTD